MNILPALRTISRPVCRRQVLESHFSSPSSSHGFKTSAVLFSKYQQILKNAKIPYEEVQLVDRETGSLIPAKMKDIIEKLDEKTEYAQLIRTQPFPLVKIMVRQEVQERKKKLKELKKERAKKTSQKEFQLTWSMDDNDLGHKLDKVREQLHKGGKADLVFAPKKKQSWPTPDEMNERVDKVLVTLQGLGKEWKERKLARGIAAVFLQGVEQIAQAKDVEDIVED